MRSEEREGFCNRNSAVRWPTICWEHEKSGWNLFTKHCVVEVPSSMGEKGLSTLGGVGKGKIRKGVPYHAMIAKRKPMIKTLIYWFQRSEFKFSRRQLLSTWIFLLKFFFSCYLRVIGNFMIGDAIEVTLLFSASIVVGFPTVAFVFSR